MDASNALENVLLQVGTGKWSCLQTASLFLVLAIQPIYLLGSEFQNPATPYTCYIPDDKKMRAVNGSQCQMIEEDSGGLEIIIPCDKWNFNTSVFHSTITMEWNLVCNRQNFSPLFQAMYTAGCFLGSIFGGLITSRYGRLLSLRAGALFTVGLTLLMLFSPWFGPVILARLFLGVFFTLMNVSGFAIVLETCPPHLRKHLIIFSSVPHAVMVVGLSGTAYVFRDWRLIQIALSWPCLLILLLTFFMDESPRWLIVNGRLEEAIQVLQRALRLNQSPSSKELDVTQLVHSIHEEMSGKNALPHKEETNFDPSHQIISSETNPKSAQPGENKSNFNLSSSKLGLDDGMGPWWAGPVALVRTKVIREVTMVLLTIWFLVGVVWLGLPLRADSFSSPFVYMAVLGGCEIPAYILPVVLPKAIGRITVLSISLFSCGLMLFAEAGLIYVYEDHWLHMLAAMISYFLVCAAHDVNYLYTQEIFPTTLRSLGFSACILSTYIGYSLSPFITVYGGDDLKWVTPCILGSCAVVAGCLLFFLMETNGRSLPETVSDLQKWKEGEMLMEMKDKITDDALTERRQKETC